MTDDIKALVRGFGEASESYGNIAAYPGPAAKACRDAALADLLAAIERRGAGQQLWCVHVRGPDDLVPVASYDDAVLLADGLNWWWQTLPLTENDTLISAVPALWDGPTERFAAELAKLGTKGWDYAMPTEAQVEAQREKAFAARIAATAARAPAPKAEG